MAQEQPQAEGIPFPWKERLTGMAFLRLLRLAVCVFQMFYSQEQTNSFLRSPALLHGGIVPFPSDFFEWSKFLPSVSRLERNKSACSIFFNRGHSSYSKCLVQTLNMHHLICTLDLLCKYYTMISNLIRRFQELNWCFSYLNVHTYDNEILLKFRLQLSSSEVGTEIPHCFQAPG